MTSVLVMAKAPRAGAVKTRLEPLLGARGCATLQSELIHAAAQWATAAADDGGVFVCAGVGEAERLRPLVGPGARLLEDREGDLGDRLAAATGRVLAERDGPLLVIGTDAPTLTPAHAAAATTALAGGADVCFGPAADGGYYLVGMSRPAPELFALGEAWGGPEVLERSLRRAAEAGLTTGLLDVEHDLDRPEDAHTALADPRLPAAVAEALRPGTEGPLVSVIVPTFDEQAELPGVLDHLHGLPGRFEVLVADGGSCDDTVAIAAAHPVGARVLSEGDGRAGQLNAAAADARGELLLFLHADSRLPPRAWEALAAAYRDGSIAGGNFTLRFDGDDPLSRVLTRAYALQRRRGYYYGDSSVWVRREVFEALGGYRPLAIMDDYDFVRRLERHGPTARLPGPALTSPRRWRRIGVPRTLVSWWLIRGLFVAGVPADLLAGLYGRIR